MAKGQFKVMDSDIHVDEPHDLWVKYMEPRFKDRAPRFSPIDGSHMNGWQFEGKVFPAFFDRPERRRLGLIRREKARARHLATGRYKEPAEPSALRAVEEGRKHLAFELPPVAVRAVDRREARRAAPEPGLQIPVPQIVWLVDVDVAVHDLEAAPGH